MEHLIIKGAREHNLKNIDLTLPRDKLIVVSGISASLPWPSAGLFIHILCADLNLPHRY